ncbi:hypothetical protein [Candidatus Harpocratesius sp.]
MQLNPNRNNLSTVAITVILIISAPKRSKKLIRTNPHHAKELLLRWDEVVNI